MYTKLYAKMQFNTIYLCQWKLYQVYNILFYNLFHDIIFKIFNFSKRFVCDGLRHCSDNSDEWVEIAFYFIIPVILNFLFVRNANFCALHTCQPSEFRCRNGRCIPQPERCDRGFIFDGYLYFFILLNLKVPFILFYF